MPAVSRHRIWLRDGRLGEGSCLLGVTGSFALSDRPRRGREGVGGCGGELHLREMGLTRADLLK